MTVVVFLGRPITHATSGETAYADRLRDALAASGLTVRYGGELVRATARDTAEHNIAAVATADVLVALLPRVIEKISSVWVEIGIALASSVPVVIVARDAGEARLPFILESLRPSQRAIVHLVYEEPVDAIVTMAWSLVTSQEVRPGVALQPE